MLTTGPIGVRLDTVNPQTQKIICVARFAFLNISEANVSVVYLAYFLFSV